MKFEAPQTTVPATEVKKTGFKIVKKEAPDLGAGVTDVKKAESLSSKPKTETGLGPMALRANESRLAKTAFETDPVGGLDNLIRNIEKITPDDAEDLLARLPGIGANIYDEAFARKSQQLTRMLENRRTAVEPAGAERGGQGASESKREDPALVRVAALGKEAEAYAKTLESDPDAAFEMSMVGRWSGEIAAMDRETKMSPRTKNLVSKMQAMVLEEIIKTPAGFRKDNLNKLKFKLEELAAEGKRS